MLLSRYSQLYPRDKEGLLPNPREKVVGGHWDTGVGLLESTTWKQLILLLSYCPAGRSLKIYCEAI